MYIIYYIRDICLINKPYRANLGTKGDIATVTKIEKESEGEREYPPTTQTPIKL